MGILKEKKITLAVTGSIAIYKIPELIRMLTNEGAEVKIIMSKAACDFMTPVVFQTLSGADVTVNHMEIKEGRIQHIECTRGADVFLVAPATANTIAKMAHGLADDIVSSAFLAYSGKVVVAPAMNVRMWKHPATKKNLESLVKMGVRIVNPSSGYLACGDEGEGRLAELQDIYLEVLRATTENVLEGKRVLVTGGATREYFDPVRYITNGSTGIMGVALASSAYAMGADVFFITGKMHPYIPSQIKHTEVVTASDMLDKVRDEVKNADILLMSAAVADYTPAVVEKKKIKKGRSDFKIELKRTKDILQSIKKLKGKKFFVGFSAETHNLIENSREKLKKKGLDAIVANKIPESFGAGKVEGLIIEKSGRTTKIEAGDKMEFSLFLLRHLAEIIRDNAL